MSSVRRTTPGIEAVGDGTGTPLARLTASPTVCTHGTKGLLGTRRAV